MQTDNKSITKRSFLLLLSLVATLTLTISVLSQKQDGGQGKAPVKGKQDESGKKNKNKASETQNRGPGGQHPCLWPSDDGEDEPRVATNTSGGRMGNPNWNPPSTPVLVSNETANCVGDIIVTMSFGVWKKGVRYYQIVIPSNAGLALVDDTALNQVKSLDFTQDCEKKTVTLTFRQDTNRSRRPSRSFFIQWMKPVGNNLDTKQTGPSAPASGYQKGKAHRVKIVCQ